MILSFCRYKYLQLKKYTGGKCHERRQNNPCHKRADRRADAEGFGRI